MRVKKKKRGTFFRNISCPKWLEVSEKRVMKKIGLEKKSELWVLAFGLAYQGLDDELAKEFSAWLDQKGIDIK